MLQPAFKRLVLWGLLGLLAATMSRCFLNVAFGKVFTDANGDSLVQVGFESQMSICDEIFGGEADPFFLIACLHILEGEGFSFEVDSELTLQNLTLEQILFLLFLDPVIVQVPELSTSPAGTFDDGTGDQSLVITEVSSFDVQPGTTVIPEAGQKFFILELPPSVTPTITESNPFLGPPFDFSFQFEVPQLAPVNVKAMFTGKVELDSQTFYVPLLPCVTDFASIPAFQIPVSNDSVDLMPQLGSLLSGAGNPGCDNEVYDFGALAQNGPSVGTQTPVGSPTTFLAESSTPSDPGIWFVAGPIAAAVLTLAVAAWYVLRRWLGRES
ncbi:MAG: hypothetical protein ACE5Q6_22145 [Dehalococcoidia bacterium]